MILLEHHNGMAVTAAGVQTTMVAHLYQMANREPDAEFVVYAAGLDPQPFIQAIERKRAVNVLLSTSADLNRDFGYVEDSPFIKVNPDVIYPTWKKSTACFYLSSALINQIAINFAPTENLLYWLNSVAKTVQPQGVLCYQVPTHTDQEILTTIQLYKFIAQYYKRRWTLLLLLSHLWYEGRFPLFAFAKAQFYKPRQVTIDVTQLKQKSKTQQNTSTEYDVVIPTIGRSSYLKQVLLDLNKQVILPQKVIVIEQPTAQSAASELVFLQDLEWHFELIHEFTIYTGACRARNRAVQLSTAPWILLFDDDVRVDPAFMTKAFASLIFLQVNAMTFSCLQKTEIEKNSEFLQWKTFGSGCSIVHRGIIEVCAFDVAMEHGYGEDMDYGMQIRNAGYDVIYNPHVQLLHLKAPVGGFRTPVKFPWNNEAIKPKPSPQIMYYRQKNTTPTQLKGYKLVLFIKFYLQQEIRNPISYYKYFRKAWSRSLFWASKLPVHG